MISKLRLSVGLVVLLSAALAPASSRAGTEDLNKAFAENSAMVGKSDALRVEMLNIVLGKSTVKTVGILQVQAIKDLIEIYSKSTTSEALKTRIVTVLLVDTVDAHPWQPRIACKAIEAMDVLYAGAGDVLKKTIRARLTLINTTYDKYRGMYDKDRSHAAGGVLNRISPK